MKKYREFWILTRRDGRNTQVYDLDYLSDKEKENLKSNYGDELVHVCEVPKQSSKSLQKAVRRTAIKLCAAEKGLSFNVASAIMESYRGRGLITHFERLAKKKLNLGVEL